MFYQVCRLFLSDTHWVFEILNMLLANKAELVDVHKIVLMLSTNTEEKLARFPSPRVLNPHVKFSRLPRQLKEKGSNIVLVLRNPKDVAVSFYHHHKGLEMHHYHGKFSDYLPLFIEGNRKLHRPIYYLHHWVPIYVDIALTRTCKTVSRFTT